MIASKWDEVELRTVLFYLKYYYTRLHELVTTNEEGESFIKDEVKWMEMQFGLLQGLFPLSFRQFFKHVNGGVAGELVDEHKVTDFLIKELNPFKLPVKALKGLIGPLEFNYLSTSEFALADIKFLLVKDSILKNDDDAIIKHLRYFMAILYREKGEKFTGDIREPFNKHSVEIRAKKFGVTDKWLMMAVMLWYESHRLALPKKYPHAFEGGEDPADKKLPDWQAAMLTVAEIGTFGDFYGVEQTPVLYFIKEIDRKRKLVKDELEAMKKGK